MSKYQYGKGGGGGNMQKETLKLMSSPMEGLLDQPKILALRP